MGSHGGLSQPDVFCPNGLLPDGAASVTRVLDAERWSIAEERISELIGSIQPNEPSEDRRKAVADYVQRLIAKCFSCQVFTFGSVPLKTYLPDGDIDLTAFSKNQDLKDTWAIEVRDMLEKEEKSDNAEFCVKEVQYIQAEDLFDGVSNSIVSGLGAIPLADILSLQVKIIKCLVENIVVDISFNQLGGLSTLCFLEEVDSLINQNHVFKRSVILIKAWCYYESRILGAHHGLISTYALETLVLYIFHVYNNDFAGPLEVLYRFLEFFSKFDWEHFCLSLWGPVPISSLPNVIADPPRKDGRDLLLSEVFLRACNTVYSVFPAGQENNELPFISKHFNVIDPLRANNNLGRSVSKGNFFRIRSAFTFGAQKLARLLECPRENIITEVNHFFKNTWDRNGKGPRPDALDSGLYSEHPLSLKHVNGSDNTNPSSRKKVECMGNESKVEKLYDSHASNGILLQKGSPLVKRNSRTTNNISVKQSQKTSAKSTLSGASNLNHHMPPNYDGKRSVHSSNGRDSKPDYLGNEVNYRYQFARSNSAAEHTGRENGSSYQSKHNRTSETIRDHAAVTRSDHGRKYEASIGSGARNASVSSNSALDKYFSQSSSTVMQEDETSAGETLQMHQEEQDHVNMMASSRSPSIGGQFQMPIKFAASHLPVQCSPSVLASMGYPNRIPGGMVPNGITSFQMPWASHAHYSQGLVPVPQFPSSVRMTSHHQDEIVEPTEDCFTYEEICNGDTDQGHWSEQNGNSLEGFDRDDEGFHMQQLEKRKLLVSGGSAVLSPTLLPCPENYLMKGHGSIYEDRSARENYGDNRRHQRQSEVYSSSQGSLPAARATSSRSKLSSEGSCDASSLKSSRSVREMQERVDRKSVPFVERTNMYKQRLQDENDTADFLSPQTDDDYGEWIPLSTGDSEVAENMVADNVPPFLRFHQMPSYETEELGTNPKAPIIPVPIATDSRQRMYDDNGALPLAFYPAGPPVPFVTMLPFYSLPSEMEAAERSGSRFEREENFDSSHVSEYGQRLPENFDRAKTSVQSNMKCAPSEESSQDKSDILNGDLVSHLQNLQYGRFCQSPLDQEPVLYPSPAAVPPMSAQGYLPSDVPGRPLSANASLFTQLMGYGPGSVDVSSVQPSQNRSGSAYQTSGDDIPRYRGGTGTYLPNAKLSWDRSSSKARNNRGNYSYDRKDHNADRDLNGNLNSKQRFAGCVQGRNQVEKPNTRIDRRVANNNRPDQPLYSCRPYLAHSKNPRNGQSSSSNSSRQGSSNLAYGMYPLPVMNPSGAAPSGTAVPSVVMFYPYDQSMGRDSPAEQQLKFGSIGPIHFSNINEGGHLGKSSSKDVKEQRNCSVDSGHSSPDLPSSPMRRRGF